MSEQRALSMFLGLVLLLLGSLRFLHWLPNQLDKTSLRSWPSLEAAGRALPLSVVRLPTYFPEGVAWPPEEVFAGTRPGQVTLLHFQGTEDQRIRLALRQAALGITAPGTRIDPVRILERSDVDLHGVAGRLELAVCDDASPCNRIGWEWSGFAFAVVGRLSAEQLILIARSMVRETAEHDTRSSTASTATPGGSGP